MKSSQRRWLQPPGHQVTLLISILIAVLLSAPQQCLGEADETHETEDQIESTSVVPPTLTTTEPTANVTNPVDDKEDDYEDEDEEAFLVDLFPRNAYPMGGCYMCKRDGPGDPDCLSATPIKPAACFPLKSIENVTCFTYQVMHKGPRDPVKNKKSLPKRYNDRKEGKSCLEEKHTKCLEEHLNLKPVIGECIRGTYSGEYFAAFTKCMGLGSNKLIKRRDLIDYTPGEGLYWGLMGQEQYLNLILCTCQTDKCNTETIENLKNAEQVG